MSHANAALSPRARLKLARLIVEHGWPIARAAERFQVALVTANRWSQRYRAEGPAGMGDRSSRPHRSPRATPAPPAPQSAGDADAGGAQDRAPALEATAGAGGHRRPGWLRRVNGAPSPAQMPSQPTVTR